MVLSNKKGPLQQSNAQHQKRTRCRCQINGWNQAFLFGFACMTKSEQISFIRSFGAS
jgi:hypothetical protein